MFIHWDLQWDHRDYDHKPKPSVFNPTKLDTDQWMQAAQAFGAKYCVLTAPHGTGFMLWQSDGCALSSIFYPLSIILWRSREIQRVHIEDDGDIVRQGGAGEDGLDVLGERAGTLRAEGDLEAELAVGAHQGRRQHLAQLNALGQVFG